MAFKFENLQVWQKALDLSSEVHAVTRTFPREELRVLTSQMLRAADSVSLNIAEGSTGQNNGELRQFLGYALRSAIEVAGCLHIARRRRLLSEDSFARLYRQVEEVVKMLQGFRKAV